MAAPPGVSDVPPNQTLYINKLNEKIKKDELKKGLYHVFSQFGNILEVIATKTYKMRGQAWVVFDDLTGATRAMREMQNFSFYGKPMKVTYAKSKSDVVAKIDGSFKPRPKRKTEDDKVPKHLLDKRRKEEKLRAQGIFKAETKANGTEAQGGAGAGDGVSSMETDAARGPPAVPSASRHTNEPPNKILFVQNLPEDCNEAMLGMLFQHHQGFKEVRLVTGAIGIAFVEFGDEFQAGAAMEALQNFKITPTHLMRISFAKK